ncbi:MAG: dihydrofolate reductase family protein [Leptospiraceae bacterium]|nr:dihydrofolate reductase family protein [Leptospiraceae bacterium]
MSKSKVQFYTATTIDGFIADENHSLDWLFVVDREKDGFSDFFASIGAIVMGRNTFDWVVNYENIYENPEKWNKFYNNLPCWVFTNRELKPIEGAEIYSVSDDVENIYNNILKRVNGKNIWLTGGGVLVEKKKKKGFLDELILQFAPVTLGKGASLLPIKLLSTELELIKVTKNGQFIDATYEVKKRNNPSQ